MQGIYSKQFPLNYYFFVPFIIAAIVTAVHGHAVKSRNTNSSATEANASSEAAPQICRISADETITRCGTSTVLHVDSGVTNYTWSNNAVDPDMTVTHSGQYWWQFIDLTRNTVINGNFSNGKNGFSSDYTYVNPNGNTGPFGALSAEGYYSVATSPRTTHTSFSAFADHTGSNGNMMVINGSPQNNAVVWKQNITVEPNTSYIFSIWAASAHPANPAKLTFSINGTQQGVIQLTTTTGTWQNFTVQWTSGNSTSAAIGIVNQNTIANGNDFALDDIVFAPICRKYFNVTLDPNPPKPAITSN